MTSPAREYRAAGDLLRGRVVLISGATGELGRMVAGACAEHGAQTILCARDAAKLQQLETEILARGGLQPDLADLDLRVSGEEKMAELAQAITARHGALHSLAHCAALAPPAMPLEYTQAADLLDAVQINLIAPFLLTRALLPLLDEAPDASVVFTRATGDRTAQAPQTITACQGSYSASLDGALTLFRTWAEERQKLGSVRFNMVDTSGTATRMRARFYPGENTRGLSAPDALLPLYLYLIGPDSVGTNAQILRL